jgi:nucleoside-diphosphate-sugar epimerase
MSGPRILVTGAGGFVGGWMVEGLYLAGATNIRAGIGRWASAARIARFPVEIVQCDMLDAASLDAALVDIDVVIHCAVAKSKESLSVEGARLVLERAKAAGVRKVVHMSSVAIYGEAEGLVTEDTKPAGAVNEYGQGKLLAEELCRQAACPEMAVSVVRPTLVYGPFSDLWTTPYITRLTSGRWRHLGPAGEGRANLVYVGDLVRFAGHLAVTDVGPFAIFNANGPDVPTWNEYLDRFNAALGLAPLVPSTKSPGLSVAIRRPIRIVGKYLLKNNKDLLLAMSSRSSFLKDMMKKTEEDLKLNPNDDEMQLFGLDVVYSMDKANKAGFFPSTSLDQGLKHSVEWAKSVGIL